MKINEIEDKHIEKINNILFGSLKVLTKLKNF